MRDYFAYCWFGFILSLLCALPLHAEPLATNDLETFRAQLDAVEQAFPRVSNNPSEMDRLAIQIARLEQETQTCLSDYGQQQTQTQQALEHLGTASTDEPADVKTKRKELEQQQQRTEKTLAQCRLFSLRVTTLLEEISLSRQTQLRQQLFTPSHSLLDNLQALLKPEVWRLDILNTATLLRQPEVRWGNLALALLFAGMGLGVGFWWRKRLKHQHQGRQLTLATTSPTLGQTWRYLHHFSPYLLAALSGWLALRLNPVGIPPLPDNPLLGLLDTLGVTLIALALIRLLWTLTGRLLFLQQTRLYLLASLALLVTVGGAWLGYRNFASLLLTGVSGTVLVLLGAWLSLRIPKEVFDGLDEGRVPWQQRLRQQLGLKATQYVPGLVWLRLTLALLVTGIAALLLLRLWGMPEQYLTLLLNRLGNGFDIAGFKLEPLRILVGLLLTALLISMTHVLKTHVAENWLQRTGLSRAAQETAATLSGYLGIVIAIVLGLSVAGIEFKNLAIIAGALSVGIGFGLQNIVNNFVSGLILLFERPIRKGDWIKVGNAEGYVREISIRSTTIQTFDYSDIIVPNSEIISGQVTNMTLNDNIGRITLPVSVAYGTDSEQVMQILQQIMQTNPAILQGREGMEAKVLFRGFGGDALNFELRGFIHHIDGRAGVISELNLAIDKQFRHHGIEIPTLQRTNRP